MADGGVQLGLRRPFGRNGHFIGNGGSTRWLWRICIDLIDVAELGEYVELLVEVVDVILHEKRTISDLIVVS